jgi:hypothetical protein
MAGNLRDFVEYEHGSRKPVRRILCNPAYQFGKKRAVKKHLNHQHEIPLENIVKISVLNEGFNDFGGWDNDNDCCAYGKYVAGAQKRNCWK